MFELLRFWVFVSGFAVGFCWLRCGLLFVVLNFGLILGECGLDRCLRMCSILTFGFVACCLLSIVGVVLSICWLGLFG